MNSSGSTPRWHLFIPKLITVLREGYGAAALRADLVAGLTVAIVALPLAMALAIASGTTPDKGLVTAIVAGFLISALGGSRFQIGGPTGAFVVVVYDVILRHGYDGLLLATLMAGVMLVIAGWAGLGTFVKYIPQPVVTGFTAGIAVIIFSSQVKDFFGLPLGSVPAAFLDKWRAFLGAGAIDPATTGIALAALAIILALRRWRPRWPGFLIAVAFASGVVAFGGWKVATIGSTFGALSGSLPWPTLPPLSLAKAQAVLPSAFTIAFLAGVESLLCAVVADGMTGRRHRSNCELVAQGVANIASALFAGLPATGAIARTATNVRAGARSPIAGMAHALFLLLFLTTLAPLAVYIPLAALAAVLVVVAWNMSEIERFRHLLKAPLGDRAVLLLTFALTVLVDLTVAIEVGVVLAAVLFMHRMAQAVEIETHTKLIDRDSDDWAEGDDGAMRALLPPGVEAFQMRGPFFFGVASRFADVLDRLGPPPKVFILRLRQVPFIDATGVGALSSFIERYARAGTHILFSGAREQPLSVLKQMGVERLGAEFVPDFAAAVERAKAIVGGTSREA
jgi:SulP family sulfate permease